MLIFILLTIVMCHSLEAMEVSQDREDVLAQEWRADDVINKLQDNGIEAVCNVRLTEDEIESIVGALILRDRRTPYGSWDQINYKMQVVNQYIIDDGGFKYPQWTINEVRASQDYLKCRLPDLQVKFLQRLAQKISAQGKDPVPAGLSSDSFIFNVRERQFSVGPLFCRPIDEDESFLSQIHPDQEPNYRAYLLLPKPLKEVARRYISIVYKLI